MFSGKSFVGRFKPRKLRKLFVFITTTKPVRLLFTVQLLIIIIPQCSKSSEKHRKNCKCCPVSLLIARSQRLSCIQVLNCQNCSQCLKCHKSLGLLLGGVLKMSLSLSLSLYLSLSIFLVMSCLLITLNKCLKGHKSLRLLCSVVKTLIVSGNRGTKQASKGQGHLLSCCGPVSYTHLTLPTILRV